MDSLSRSLSSRLFLLSALPFTLSIPFQPQHKDAQQPSNDCTLPKINSTLTWADCDTSEGFPAGLQCATYAVPIDWSNPQGDFFNLSLVKYPAPSNSTTKIGNLFINPGGPGESAIELVAGLAAGGADGITVDIPEEFLDAFDIIGVDPRGVGLSNPIQCDMTIYAERVSLFPTTQEDFDKLEDKNKRLGASCRNLTGPLLEHVDTISAAKDHEAVRIALGDEKINLLGLSYGTQLFAQYAQLFPANIRALVLDGLLQHSQDEAGVVFTESATYENVLSRFLTFASANDTSPLKGQDVHALWTSVLANATAAPIPAPGCDGTACKTDVSVEEILFNAQGLLTFASFESASRSWLVLAQSLSEAAAGNATLLSTALTSESVSGLAISCQDWYASPNLATTVAKKTLLESFFPLTQGASQSWTTQTTCIGWPAPVVNPPQVLDVKTELAVLMVNALHDPSTSYEWALGMLQQIENKVLLTRNGDGHLSLLLGGEAAQAELTYLVTGEAPDPGTVVYS